jgi:tRNA (mo5U34)-methyltransferase
LVLETLIMTSDDESAFFPRNRYASMRNVFFIPTVSCLHNWLERSRFTNIRCVDISRTTSDEQRKTQWIDSESLDSFLDPVDSNRTIEGYPAPVRAFILADAKPLRN